MERKEACKTCVREQVIAVGSCGSVSLGIFVESALSRFLFFLSSFF